MRQSWADKTTYANTRDTKIQVWQEIKQALLEATTGSNPLQVFNNVLDNKFDYNKVNVTLTNLQLLRQSHTGIFGPFNRVSSVVKSVRTSFTNVNIIQPINPASSSTSPEAAAASASSDVALLLPQLSSSTAPAASTQPGDGHLIAGGGMYTVANSDDNNQTEEGYPLQISRLNQQSG